jgi:hypothetical protein
VLDQLSDTNSELQPKSTAQSGDVAASIRHLPHEDLQAYATGRLASARLSYCQTHLDSCEACRAELEDLRASNSDSSGFQRSQSNRRERKGPRRRRLTLPQAISVAIILVAAVSTVLWWAHENPRASRASAAVSVTQSPAAPPAARVQARDTRLADEIAALPDDVRSAVSEAIQQGRLQLPKDVSRIRGRAPTLSGAAEANTGFALLGPFGKTISETRPEFSWQPLAGAIRYSVIIVDAGLHPVQRSPSLRTTAWRPRRPLRRGHTYLWQVTATLRGGAKVVASAPSPSETLLRIQPQAPGGGVPAGSR